MYEIPPVINPDPDSYIQPLVNLGSMIAFAKVTSQSENVLFEPKKINIGEYKMKVMLEDKTKGIVLKNSISVKVKVIAPIEIFA